MIDYIVLFILLVVVELLYFRVATMFNIVDLPNGRSSHSAVVIRGGGMVFLAGVWLWCAFFGMHYGLFMAAVSIAAGISFMDDIRSLPDGLRLVVQFVAMGLLIWQLYMSEGVFWVEEGSNWFLNVVFVVVALIVCVGASNIYNFMDGINGITAGYSLAVLFPLLIVNCLVSFIEQSFLLVVCLSVLVFGFFNFRNQGWARCFAGDVGSISMAFILLFAIGKLIVSTGDVSWLIFLLVYGVDGCLTICHRIMLHEHLGEAHRKHAYQLMANELGISHPVVSLIYLGLQTAVSTGFIFLCPLVAEHTGWSLVLCHWNYLVFAFIILTVSYVLFMKKYYHLHEEFLEANSTK